MAKLTDAEITKYTSTWVELNAAMVEIDDEEQCAQLLDHEKNRASPRGLFVLRIHSRLNKLRAHRERAELMQHVDVFPESKRDSIREP